MRQSSQYVRFDEMNELEALRLRSLHRKKIARITRYVQMGISWVIAIVLVIIFRKEEDTIMLLAFLLGLIFVIIFGIIYSLEKKAVRGYNSLFRKMIVNKMINQVDPEMKYLPDKCIPYQQFEFSKLFVQQVSGYSGQNYIVKEYDNFAAYVCEIDVMYGGDSDSKSKPLFKGLFFVFAIQGSFDGQTLIVNDVKNEKSSIFGDLFTGLRETLLKLNYTQYTHMQFNDAEFEKYFEIYSNNQEETKKIVDRDLVNLLLQIRLDTGSGTRISFYKRMVCLTIQTGREHFLADVNRTVLDDEIMQRHFDDIQNIKSYMDQFVPIVNRIARY